MRIALVTSEIGPKSGGLSYSCSNYAEFLSNLGFQITIISSSTNKNESLVSSGFKTIVNDIIICEGGYRKDLKGHLLFRGYIKNIINKFRHQKFDCIVAFGAGYNGLIASEISRLTDTKLIMLLRGSEMNLSISDTTLFHYNLKCLKQADAIISLSQELLEVSKTIFFDRSKIYKVIPNWTECSKTVKIPDAKKEKILLGCGATHLNEKKGVSNLISMLKSLNDKSDIPFYFEFAGNVDFDLLSNFQNHCINLGMKNNVNFLGDLSRENFLKHLKNWDFYIQGSFCEGFSNSIADSFKNGIPMIISNSGFIAETIGKISNEIIFDDFTPETMSDKILNLVSNPRIELVYKKVFHAISTVSNVSLVKNEWVTLFEKISKASKFTPIPIQNIVSIVFHDISRSTNSHIDTNIDTFNSFVKQIYKKGYSLCSAHEYFNSKEKSKLIICTFDDAYERVYKYAFQILKSFNFTATVFVSTEYFGLQNDWNFKDPIRRKHLTISELEELNLNGWEIGSHGKSHKSFLRLSDSELIDEIRISKSILEKYFGKVESFAYPYGDYNDYIMKIVAENYSYAFSLNKGGTLNNIDNHQIRRYFISDFQKILES